MTDAAIAFATVNHLLGKNPGTGHTLWLDLALRNLGFNPANPTEYDGLSKAYRRDLQLEDGFGKLELAASLLGVTPEPPRVSPAPPQKSASISVHFGNRNFELILFPNQSRDALHVRIYPGFDREIRFPLSDINIYDFGVSSDWWVAFGAGLVRRTLKGLAEFKLIE